MSALNYTVYIHPFSLDNLLVLSYHSIGGVRKSLKTSVFRDSIWRINPHNTRYFLKITSSLFGPSQIKITAFALRRWYSTSQFRVPLKL
jgi:hypothetical protein